MHQNAFGGRVLPGLAGGACSTPPGPLAGLKGKEKEGEWEREKGRAPPVTQNASQRSSEGQNKEVGGTKFKFGQLIFRKIIKIVATRCHILRLKCTKFDSGAPPQTPLGELTALPKPSSWI